MKASKNGFPPDFFSVDEIVDAPEHHEYARAMGLLTWGTWDTEVRPFRERLTDLLHGYPPTEPLKFQAATLERTSDGEYGPAGHDARLARLRTCDKSFGTLVEVLARYGLKLRSGPAYVSRPVEVLPFREVARLRNQRLRVLHGRVDIEAENMDEAKVVELERLEKIRAAEQTRKASQQMQRELKSDE